MSKITGRMLVRDLIQSHSDAADTLSWYGLEVGHREMSKTLETICDEQEVNYWELKADLISTSDEDIMDDEDEDEDDYQEYGDYGDYIEADEADEDDVQDEDDDFDVDLVDDEQPSFGQDNMADIWEDTPRARRG